MTATTIGREPVQIVEIVQPLCANIFGSSPCTASGSNDTKCYNTRATCQDTANYDGSATLSLYFSSGRVSERGISGANYIIPALLSVSTSPTKVNLGGANPDAKGLGNRAVCTIVLKDFPHTDRLVDPYLSGRSWDPFTRSTFWAKWMVRNQYRSNILVKVYEGYAGQALGAMQVREYVMESVKGPTGSGQLTIQAKDVLAKLEERKAQCPVASPGVVFTGLGATDLVLEVANAVVADYPASGYLRIDDELIQYSARALTGAVLQFTLAARGAFATVAATHELDAVVQEAVYFNAVSLDDAYNTLLTTYGGIAAGKLDTAGWATEVDTYASIFPVSRIVSEPTSVYDLVSNLQEQTNSFLWWDDRNALVRLKVIRGINSTLDIIDDATEIIENSWQLDEFPRERVSQVWLHFDRKTAISDISSGEGFAQLALVANLDEETDALYGEPSIREIFGAWINSAALASSTAERIATRYKDPPRRVTILLDAKDRDYDIGDVVELGHYLEVDQYGVEQRRRWTIISREEVLPGEAVKYVLQDTTDNGKLYAIADTAEGAYDHTADEDRFVMWITDADGEYPGNYVGATIG